MRRPRIALVDASHGNADTRRNFRRELDADLVEFDATECDLPCTFEFDAVVVTGSRASVYDDETWIDETREWVRAAIDEHELPALGVCWGHQLLADALGGTVADMGEYEIGYRDVSRVDVDDPDPVFEGVDESFLAFTTHSDTVTVLPPGARELAANDYGTHAFRRGDVVGVQFHPEYDAETARKITLGKDELSDERKDAVLDGITPANEAAALHVKQVFENFTTIVRDRAERKTAERTERETAERTERETAERADRVNAKPDAECAEGDSECAKSEDGDVAAD